MVAFGGGGFSMEAGNPLLDQYVFGLARRPRPRVCFVPTSLATPTITSCASTALSLLPCASRVSFRSSAATAEPGRFEGDLEEHLLGQDVIHVGGGSVVSLFLFLGAARCATAVGEGAMVVRFVHERMSEVLA